MHRGELLKEVVKKSGIPVTTVIKKVGFSRTSYYNHINNRDLQLDIIAQYGKALGYDFSVAIPQLNELKNFITKKPINLQEAISEIAYWKEKYFDVLEKYNVSIETQLSNNKGKK